MVETRQQAQSSARSGSARQAKSSAGRRQAPSRASAAKKSAVSEKAAGAAARPTAARSSLSGRTAGRTSAGASGGRRLSKKARARRTLTRLCLAMFLLTVLMCILIAVLRDPADQGSTPITELDPTLTSGEVTNDRLRENLIIAGVDVGGKRGSDAAALIEATAAEAFQQDLTVTLPDRTLVLQAAELQASIDATAAVVQAQAWEGDESQTLILPGSVSVNEKYLLEQLQAVADDVYAPAAAPDVVFSDNWLFITVGQDGIKLDTDAARQAIMQALAVCDLSGVTLTYSTVHAGSVDMQALHDQYCTTPVNAFYDETTGEIVRGQVGYQFDVETAQAQVDATPAGQTCTIQLVETNPPITYSFLASLGSMSELASYSREAMGQSAPEPATYEDYPDELGKFSTEYSNNPNRTNNLIRACEIVNGTILQPGEQFSFNGVVGERTAEKGFKEAVAYVGGENVDELGGGVCQVSTTIYNAALLANLQIDERYAHIYESHYVEAGLDATVSWPNPDFKFTNSLSNPIYIEASVSGGYVNVRIMGTSETDNYVVMTTEIISAIDYYQTVYRADSSLSLNEAAVYQGGSNGYTARSYRSIYNKNGSLISTTPESYSNYTRRDRIVLVSTDSPYLD